MPSPSVEPPPSSLDRLLAWDLHWCARLNRLNRLEYPARFFAMISRAGDGAIWYGLLILLPLLYGSPGLVASGHMAVTGLACLALYRWLKVRTGRPRPFMTSSAIFRREPPLDEYSFPSGHTLHAVAFSLVLASHLPQWTALALAFTLLVTLSRPILGLHYPTDVIAGAAIGGVVACSSILLAGPLLP